jgi:deoxyribonuclease-4
MQIGAHVPARAPLESADRLGLDVFQLHLSSPRTWQHPVARDDAAELRRSGCVASVHAPYLCNPASADPLVRERTAALLQATLDAAATVGAGGVVVHAGSAGVGGAIDGAVARWRDLLPRIHGTVPLWIENTASGTASVGRHLDSIARLFAVLRALPSVNIRIGACLDTAHAFVGDAAAADKPGEWVERFAEATGGVDLVHVNDSAAPAGSGRDRHVNLGAGLMGLDRLAEMVTAAGAPVAVIETPGDDERRSQDVEILRYLATTGARLRDISDRRAPTG